MKLEGAKAGDPIIVKAMGSYQFPQVATIDRVTATQVVVGSTKYRKIDGRSAGAGAWDAWYAHLPADGEAEKVRDQERRRRLASQFQRETQWSNISLEDLEAVLSIVSKYEKPTPTQNT